MFLRFKIYFTIISLYEIVVVSFLQLKHSCTGLFSNNFCLNSSFEYFILCIACPLIVMIIAVWSIEIIKRIKRKHSLLYRAKESVQDIVLDFKKMILQILQSKEGQKYLIFAILMNAQQFVSKNTKSNKILNSILDIFVNSLSQNFTIKNRRKNKKK